jgi:lipopolysaccharide/colanic/teichoic acid biosynthesis glycosyltransferase
MQEVPLSNTISASWSASVRPDTPSRRQTYEVLKRLVDASLAVALLVLLAPVLVVCALLVALDSPGPVLYRQERVGEGGRRFAFLKFRSMHVNVDSQVHAAYTRDFIAGTAARRSDGEKQLFKLLNDPRVTRVGYWLRRFSLDELPQLWNVVRGDMSLVGPRPPVPYEVEHYLPAHMERLLVKPGITGLWQVSGRNKTTFEEMVALDVEYIRERSLRLDALILLKTVPVALLGRDGG